MAEKIDHLTVCESTGKWSFREESQKGTGISQVTSSVQVNGRTHRIAGWFERTVQIGDFIKDTLGKRRPHVVEGRLGRQGPLVRLVFEVFPGRSQMIVSIEIINDSDQPVVLGMCNLLELTKRQGGQLHLGFDSDQMNVFTYECRTTPQLVKHITSDGGQHDNAPTCHLSDSLSGKTYHASFLTVDRAYCGHVIRYSKREKNLRHEAWCNFNDYELQPGDRIQTEKLWVELADSPYETLERWADKVHQIYKPAISEEIPVGWIGWAWGTPLDNETQEDYINRHTAAIQKRLPGFGVDYVWASVPIKDGLVGNWEEFDDQNYPHGIPWLVELLKKRTMKLGLWLAPFWVVKKTDGYRKNKNRLLCDSEGTPRSPKRWNWAYNAPEGQEPHLYCLDASHPDTVDYLAKTLRAYREMGVRYAMFDFQQGGRPLPEDVLANPAMVKGTEPYRCAMKAMREAAGPDFHILSGTGGLMDNIGISDSFRIGADYGEGRPILPRFHAYPAPFEIDGADFSTSTPHRNVLQNLASTWFVHRRFWQNSINILVVSKPISRPEVEISTTLFGMSGGPLFLGDEMDTLDEDRLTYIKKVLPRLPETARPLDLFERVYPEDYARVLSLPIQTGWGKWNVVALFNLDDKPKRITLPVAKLGLKKRRSYRLYNFWQECYCGCFSDTLEVDIAPFSCQVLRIEEAKKHPWLLSTDMHLRQGQAEIASMAWDAGKMILSGVAKRPKGETGSLILHSPVGFKPIDYTGLEVAKTDRDSSLIIRKKIHFKKASMPWEMQFEKIPVSVWRTD